MIFSCFRLSHSTGLFLENPNCAYIYYKNRRKNLLTGLDESVGIESFLSEMAQIQLNDQLENRVQHFFYEAGFLFLDLKNYLKEDDPIVIDIQYQKKIIKKNQNSFLKKIKLKSLERPSWSEYKDAFNQVQDHLELGNAYQVNLTYPYYFMSEDFYDPRDLSSFLMANPLSSSYAHFTFTGESAFFSNSPECLFHYENSKMKTMPIKGTIKSDKSFQENWRELTQDIKQESELFMIIDLLRNDLNRLDLPMTKVLRSKVPLKVSGLLHQYAEIELELKNNVNLLRVFEGMFPGGSITGAPKKRVVEIISQVERWTRGFYTGSTLLFLGNRKIASINIRSSEISLEAREWVYGAGGGITLLSKAAQEFQEMESKVSSFLTMLNS